MGNTVKYNNDVLRTTVKGTSTARGEPERESEGEPDRGVRPEWSSDGRKGINVDLLRCLNWTTASRDVTAANTKNVARRKW